MRSKIITLLWLFCACSFLYGIGLLYYKLTGDFQIAHITYAPQKYWPLPPLADEEQKLLSDILKHRLTYLGKGNQSYVFASQDQKYVIKFFNFRHLKNSWWEEKTLSLPFLGHIREKRQTTKKKKLNRVFEGHRIAYLYDRQDSGLLFVHLNKSDNLKVSAQILDGLGNVHNLNLDDYIFVVQKKVTPTQEIFSRLLKQGDVNTVKAMIGDLFALYVREYNRGVLDKDQNLMINTGFDNNTPIRMDVGKVIFDNDIKDREAQKKDLKKIALNRIDKWVSKHYPQYREQIMTGMNDHYYNLFDTPLN